MKKGALLLCCVTLVVLCTSSPTAGGYLGIDGPAFPEPNNVLQAHKGPKPATGHLRNKRHIATLQASQTTHLQLKASSGKDKASHATTKTKSLLQKLTKVQRLKKMFKAQLRKRRVKIQKQVRVGICKSNKLRWWIKIKKKCVGAYGKGSKWDREKLDGKCAEAWSECTTGFYAACCSQPLGPKNMEAYCANQALTVVKATDVMKQDKACQVQANMKGVQQSLSRIKDTISLLDASSPSLYAPGPSPMPAPATAAMVAPPPGLMPISYVGAGPAPAPTPSVDRCAMLMELTRQAAVKIQAIKSWANKPSSTQEGSDVEGEEARDPDLAFSVKGVLRAGEKLDAIMKDPNFCDTGNDDDDDEDDVEKDPTQDWDGDSEDEESAINETAIMGLLSWESDMANAVDSFEKDVHPHGFKWWRYRYEYTIVESLVLAISVVVMYFVMWLLHGVSFFQSTKFYKTGRPERLLRYAWAYLVFHSATLMIMVTFAYMLYIPWGKHNIFDIFASAFHDLVDGRANVPFLGYSWLIMVLDVQFQLFVCFALYSLFIVFVVRNNQKALEDWKLLSENTHDPSAKLANAQLFRSFENIIRKRVQNSPEYRQMFHELKVRFPGVSGLEGAGQDWSEFKLHLYLTDGLGKSVEYLVQVSLTTNLFLACSALVVALLASHFQVAFMYFLPGFIVIGIALFIAGYFVARHFRALSDNDEHNTPSKYATAHGYCRAIQIMLYCVLYSFSRLLLSNDIFEFYPRVYISALVALVVVLVLLAVVAGEVIKETSCALILPPHIPADQFKLNLEQIVHWHTTQKCHECGVHQLPAHSSYSREWAGKAPTAERKEGTPDSARLFSWRG